MARKSGRIVQRGIHDELIEEEGLYREIYDLELRDQEEAYERTRAEASAAPSPAGGSA